MILGSPKAKNYGVEASLGNVPDVITVNKFGTAIDCDSGTETDIWDGADGSTSTDIWAPPTTSRVHQLTSSSANDDEGSTGAIDVKVQYLPDWDSKEVSITITLNGTANVALPSLVMINRMECLTWGTGGVNIGVITATADTDGTVTSAILAGNNQTQQIMFGFSSLQDLRVESFYASLVKGTGTTQRGDGLVLFMPDPETNVVDNTAWVNKENFLLVEANPPWEHHYQEVPKSFSGPGILKTQVTTNSNNTQVIASFNAFLIDK